MKMRPFRLAACVAIHLAAIVAVARLAGANPIDKERARSAGIRELASRHLILYTDLPADSDVDELPAIFDKAVPQWSEYFAIDAARTADWQARAFLIRERRRFDALGLMPAGNDQFVNGISVGTDMWLYDQPTAYYRRHLLLHEGTHVFMAAFLGGCGPGWFMEGTAELLATHRLDGSTGQLTLRIMPRNRRDVPMLGRIKLIRDACAKGQPLGFQDVLRIDNRQQLGNEAYAWCWAACKFLDAHPNYRARFRSLREHVLDRRFNELVRRRYDADWQQLTAEWQAFVATLDHGYNFERMTIDFEPGKPLDRQRKLATVAADRGWQSSGVRLEAGRSYRVTASGRYQIAVETAGGADQPWPCEPGGVTIEYHAGRPLGMLLGAIASESNSAVQSANAATDDFDEATFSDPIAIGLGRTVKPSISGTLYLRVNDSPARLDDNRGNLTVSVAAVDTQ